MNRTPGRVATNVEGDFIAVNLRNAVLDPPITNAAKSNPARQSQFVPGE